MSAPVKSRPSTKRKGPRKASGGKPNRCVGCVCSSTYDDASSDIAKVISDRMEPLEAELTRLDSRITDIEHIDFWRREIKRTQRPWYRRLIDWFVG